MVQHGEYTGGALWYSKVRPAEVAEVMDGAGDTGLALGRGGAVTVGGRTGLMYCTTLPNIAQSLIYFSNKSLALHIPVHPPKTAYCPTHCPPILTTPILAYCPTHPTLYTLIIIYCPTHCPTHSHILHFQKSGFIVLVHTNGLGYHGNVHLSKHSSVDFLREVLSTLGLQGMEGGGEGPGGRGQEDSRPVLSV